jgi:hypothetical protein
MNERIKLLIERAEYQAQKQSGSDWEVHVEPSREQIFEKFAELIVRECMDIVIAHEDDAPKEFHKLWSHMKQHFGVK